MALDDTNLEIIIEPSPNLNHEQTTVAGASSVPQDESRGLNEMTSEDLTSLKNQVCEYARNDNWKEAEPIFNKYPDMVRIPVNDNRRDTALHVAVMANSITFVKSLVNLMTPLDLQICNGWGWTAFQIAESSSGNSDLVQLMNEIKHDLASLKKQVCEYAREDKWKEAEPIFNKYPDMVRTPLTDNKNTALHEAVHAKSITFVKGLVNRMTPQDLQIPNSNGHTAFLMAAESGNSDLLQIMIEKNQNLPLIKERYGRNFPVHLAAIKGHHKIVQDLSSKTLLQKMDPNSIENLFFGTIDSDMFDVTTKLFEEYPANLAIAKCDRDEQTALEILLRKPSKELRASQDSLELLKRIWLQLGWTRILELIYSGSLVSAMADALDSGNVEAVKRLLSMNPELLTVQDTSNILHHAIRQRHSSIVSYIFKKVPPNLAKNVLKTVDEDGNNILHLAAYPLREENSSSLTATTKMTRDVAWFKDVEKKVPRELRTMTNKEGMTPKRIFVYEHKILSIEVKDTAKVIADSGMVVAALVATVAFAAALVVPGDKTNPWFPVFILANAAALFTSSASIFFFLSNSTTSKFAESEFVIALHPSLILGPKLLHISIVTMIISFAAASFLIFEHTFKWAAYVVASMGVFPILLVLVFQFSILDTFLWSRFYLMS